MRQGRGDRRKKKLCEWLVDIYSKLVHEFPAVSSLAEARHFAIISLIRIKQVVIPTNNMVSRDCDLQEMFNNRERESCHPTYVSSSPAQTFLLAIRTIRLSSCPTLIILAQQFGVHCTEKQKHQMGIYFKAAHFYQKLGHVILTE